MTKLQRAIERALERTQRRRRLPSPHERRRLRERAGLTQAELATLLGVNEATVTRYERGARTPRGAMRDKYVEACEELARATQKPTA